MAAHHQHVRAGRGKLRRVAPFVDVRRSRAPGAEHGGRRRDVDAGFVRPRPVLEGGPRRGIGRHRAVDCETGGLAHLLEKGVLHRLLAGRQHQFEVRAIVHVGEDGPGRAVDGLDRGQADGEGQAEETEVRVPVAGAAVAEDTEHEAAPWLRMDRTVEEGAARQIFQAGGVFFGAIQE